MLNPEIYIPHNNPMVLIDSVIKVDRQISHCKSIITKQNIFYDHSINGIFSWIGVEFMAQSVAVYGSFQRTNKKPQIGFLISIRNFRSTKQYFELGESLDIIAENIYSHDGVGVFNCKILIQNKEIAYAKLSALEINNNNKRIKDD